MRTAVTTNCPVSMRLWWGICRVSTGSGSEPWRVRYVPRSNRKENTRRVHYDRSNAGIDHSFIKTLSWRMASHRRNWKLLRDLTVPKPSNLLYLEWRSLEWPKDKETTLRITTFCAMIMTKAKHLRAPRISPFRSISKEWDEWKGLAKAEEISRSGWTQLRCNSLQSSGASWISSSTSRPPS